MIRKIAIVVALISVIGLSVSAKIEKEPEKTLVQWSEEQANTKPAIIDGVQIFRPNGTDDDGVVRVNGFVDLPKTSKQQAFTAALISVSNVIDRELEEIQSIDFDNMRFVFSRQIVDGEGRDEKVYRYTIACQFTDELMTFSCYDVNIEFKEKGIFPRKLDLEKFKPATKKDHAEIVESFSVCNSKVIDKICKDITSSDSIEITHWEQIKEGYVVKGMNENEVILIGGRPRSVNNSGARTQWIYNNDFIVIFENGIVSNVIQ